MSFYFSWSSISSSFPYIRDELCPLFTSLSPCHPNFNMSTLKTHTHAPHTLLWLFSPSTVLNNLSHNKPSVHSSLSLSLCSRLHFSLSFHLPVCSPDAFILSGCFIGFMNTVTFFYLKKSFQCDKVILQWTHWFTSTHSPQHQPKVRTQPRCWKMLRCARQEWKSCERHSCSFTFHSQRLKNMKLEEKCSHSNPVSV